MKIAVAADGSRAAICELARLVVVEIPSGGRVGELQFDRDGAGVPAHAREVAWLGGDQLFVLARYAAHTHVALVEIARVGPRTLTELQIDEPMHLRATAGAHALVTGASAAYVLEMRGDELHVEPFAVIPRVAGATSRAFVVGLTDGAIELWSPRGRVAALGRRADATWLGATDDGRVWSAHGAVLELGDRRYALPEPIRDVACDPTTGTIACLGDAGVYVCGDDVAPLAIARQPIALAVARGGRALVAQDGGVVSVIEIGAGDDWRARLCAWAFAAPRGPLPALRAIDDALRTRDLDRALAPAVALLYAASIAGELGCAPADVAAVSGRWPEALGTGVLAARGIAVYAASRVALAEAVQRELDAAR